MQERLDQQDRAALNELQTEFADWGTPLWARLGTGLVTPLEVAAARSGRRPIADGLPPGQRIFHLALDEATSLDTLPNIWITERKAISVAQGYVFAQCVCCMSVAAELSTKVCATLRPPHGAAAH